MSTQDKKSVERVRPAHLALSRVRDCPGPSCLQLRGITARTDTLGHKASWSLPRLVPPCHTQPTTSRCGHDGRRELSPAAQATSSSSMAVGMARGAANPRHCPAASAPAAGCRPSALLPVGGGVAAAGWRGGGPPAASAAAALAAAAASRGVLRTRMDGRHRTSVVVHAAVPRSRGNSELRPKVRWHRSGAHRSSIGGWCWEVHGGERCTAAAGGKAGLSSARGVYEI